MAEQIVRESMADQGVWGAMAEQTVRKAMDLCGLGHYGNGYMSPPPLDFIGENKEF